MFLSPRKGAHLSSEVYFLRLDTIKEYFKWLVESRVISNNPASEIELGQVLKKIVSIEEAEKILNKLLDDFSDAIVSAKKSLFVGKN